MRSSAWKDVLLVVLEEEGRKLGGLTTFVHLKEIAFIHELMTTGLEGVCFTDHHGTVDALLDHSHYLLLTILAVPVSYLCFVSDSCRISSPSTYSYYSAHYHSHWPWSEPASTGRYPAPLRSFQSMLPGLRSSQ